MKTIYDFSAIRIDGKEESLDVYRGKQVLIINVASKCGFTHQYRDLERLYISHKDQGLVLLGFPCDQFGGQEPGTNEEIQSFCQIRYGVTFPMFSKIDVNGKNAHPLFQFLKESLPGWLGFQRIVWNFTKFLVDREGKPIKRFGSASSPKRIEAFIDRSN